MDSQQNANMSPRLHVITGISGMNSRLKVTSFMKGERIVIPTSCRDSILADLHRSHEGINKSLTLARTCVYWPGMEADVTDYIKEMLNLHRQHQAAHGDTAPTRGFPLNLGSRSE